MINKYVHILNRKILLRSEAVNLSKKRINLFWHHFSNTTTARATSVESNQSYINYLGKNPLAYRNIGQELERVAVDYGSNEAIVSCHESKRYTFRSLIDQVDRLAASLLKLGLKKGDYIGLWGPNNLHWYLTMLAASRAGLISVGINPAFQAPEIEYCLKKVNIKVLVTPLQYKSQNFYEIVHSICPELTASEKGPIKSKNLPNLERFVIDADSVPRGALTFSELLDLSNTEEIAKIAELQKFIIPDSPCNVQFTSGTTGNPKAAVLSHFNFVNNGIHIGNRNCLEGQRICVQVPLFHAFGVVITVMAAMSKGATLVLPSPGFNAEESLKAVVKERCTVMHGTPTMYVDVVRKQEDCNYDLDTLKMAVTGGAPCSPQLFLNIQKILKVDEVRNLYGLTETTAAIFQSRPDDNKDQVLNTVGHIQDNIEAKIIDSEGHTVPFGQPGELCIRGYCTMLGYHGDIEKTQETIGADKWLYTGDQFILEADGYGRIVGRLKEMIIRGGENIFPKEIEDFLNTHPNILETHVIGVPDERMGEEICAFVRLTDTAGEITRTKLKEFCKGRLAHFKVPYYVIAVKEFPKTTSGKIQKFKLLQQFEEKFNTKQLNAGNI
ncbi:medium-chain acyl-CoA ligase ACSF2, mitochondrial [Glossina fuscipes]|uniref:Medium-chain acyl-CoA ligase ACSF2, mitochondrial n=1 Tax=Glossina fuscipes TaxID=7396 RepID=A0A8U0WEU2_9MUSC|nr:medium-chain acyl-CoA ligase ACSF2, mitochondrial [Glossina fuscipes]KAI9586319.1 hypothetical protein GQX74_002166 [Glossina fuscipes]